MPINGSVSLEGHGIINYTDVKSLLSIFLPNDTRVEEIEAKLPLLTIFVPTLPESSFSADLWNTENEIPEVALRFSSTNDVPIFDTDEEEMYVLDSDLIPSYPIVVVKDNERIRIDLEKSAGNTMPFTMLSDNFVPVIEQFPGDGSGMGSGWTSPGSGNGNGCAPGFVHVEGRQHTVNSYLIDSYEVFEGFYMVQQAWQRDNLYYQLTPSNTEDFYVGDYYKEAVTYFRLSGNPYLVFNQISNQQSGPNPDPVLEHENWATNPAWADGSFEIQINVRHGSKSDEFINKVLYFPASPSDLFEIEHQTERKRRKWWHWWNTTYYRTKINGFKGMDFTSTNINDIQLYVESWDLNDYSNRWNYHVSEIDTSIENTISTTSARKYNANFEVSGSIKKIGLKLGAELELNESETRQLKWIDQNDFLGEVNVNFGDRILQKSQCDILYPMIYSSSMINLEIRPVQTVF